jgi:hypothetical protein
MSRAPRTSAACSPPASPPGSSLAGKSVRPTYPARPGRALPSTVAPCLDCPPVGVEAGGDLELTETRAATTEPRRTPPGHGRAIPSHERLRTGCWWPSEGAAAWVSTARAVSTFGWDSDPGSSEVTGSRASSAGAALGALAGEAGGGIHPGSPPGYKGWPKPWSSRRIRLAFPSRSRGASSGGTPGAR